MNPDIKNLFNGSPNARASVKHSIFLAIAAREERRNRIRKWTLSTIVMVTGIATIPAVIELGTRASQSGSFQYLSLAFSGGFASAWRDMMLAFVESLPIESLIICLAIIAICLWSARAVFRTTKSLKFKTV